MAKTKEPSPQKKLLQDCFVVLVSLSLGEHKLTKEQKRGIANLIKRLVPHVKEG